METFVIPPLVMTTSVFRLKPPAVSDLAHKTAQTGCGDRRA
jgi:hypothetical protein